MSLRNRSKGEYRSAQRAGSLIDGKTGWWFSCGVLVVCLLLLYAGGESFAGTTRRAPADDSFVDALYLWALRHGVAPAPLIVSPPLAEPVPQEVSP
jgi:hypothetical protein